MVMDLDYTLITTSTDPTISELLHQYNLFERALGEIRAGYCRTRTFPNKNGVLDFRVVWDKRARSHYLHWAVWFINGIMYIYWDMRVPENESNGSYVWSNADRNRAFSNALFEFPYEIGRFSIANISAHMHYAVNFMMAAVYAR